MGKVQKLPNSGAVSFFFLLVLVGCYNPSTEISGRVVKGVMHQAIVNAYAIKNGQLDTVPLVSSRTDIAGDYRLRLDPRYSGPTAIVVTADALTSVVCDHADGCTSGGAHIAFGDTYPASPGLTLRALIADVTASGGTSAHVTPMSEMAAAQANASAILDSATIGAANADIEKRFYPHFAQEGGANGVLTIRPSNIASLKEIAIATRSSIFAGFLAAGATIKAESEFGGDLTAAINALDVETNRNCGEGKGNLTMQMHKGVNAYHTKFPDGDSTVSRMFGFGRSDTPAAPATAAPTAHAGGGCGGGGGGGGGGGSGGGGGGGGM